MTHLGFSPLAGWESGQIMPSALHVHSERPERTTGRLGQNPRQDVFAWKDPQIFTKPLRRLYRPSLKPEMVRESKERMSRSYPLHHRRVSLQRGQLNPDSSYCSLSSAVLPQTDGWRDCDVSFLRILMKKNLLFGYRINVAFYWVLVAKASAIKVIDFFRSPPQMWRWVRSITLFACSLVTSSQKAKTVDTLLPASSFPLGCVLKIPALSTLE